MLELSEIIATGLLQNTAVATIVGTKVFPLLADQEVDIPFIVYRVAKFSQATKDNAFDYEVTIISYTNTYNDSLSLADAVIEAMKVVNLNNKAYTFNDAGATPFVDEEQKYYVEQKLNIKK